MNIKAIIGLGNPGPRFALTRHNIGFLVVDALADKHGASWAKKDEFEYAEITLNGQKIHLVKPQTFMNNSGRVIPWLTKKGIKPEEILVVHDELEQPFGKVMFRTGGSARGHNGLKSIISTCGDTFHRIRCGISRPEDRATVSDYVLMPFSESDEQVTALVTNAVTLIESTLAT
jgi:PTH1 family peptidyl-tRNA hydrolase